jgi:hypothetical protein
MPVNIGPQLPVSVLAESQQAERSSDSSQPNVVIDAMRHALRELPTILMGSNPRNNIDPPMAHVSVATREGHQRRYLINKVCIWTFVAEQFGR